MIETARLLLRWPEPQDFAARAATFADRETMALFGPGQDEDGVRADLARHASYHPQGLGFWSVLERESGAWVGFCGLKPGAPDTPIEREIEVGWLIARSRWGRGYATEAARAALDHAWRAFDARRAVAIVARPNAPSHAVAIRLGMQRLPALDFLHPKIDPTDPLAAMNVYAIDRPA
ncbi:GNAT family N-acetyltransferase [Sphingomonas baiyangensis]|uniref:GNAT family N-acetyltransferase n=1 Tax=Sphingomonas baiyangensis TaxID=2572576 RepID=A0A4U1L1S4_9SPHN|nr:GNAT family N-acetyltransferase [Sphingomonas baiyangensis]TKD50807.1 GNAT family N-acetyltransferase [Sphingomonas baiyangensis]